jgi:phosphohistidine phosphatase
MLTLMLLRHAKAEQGYGHDFERALTPRGEADAAAVGRHVAGLRIVPNFAVVSPAARAKKTFELFQEALGGDVPVRYDERLYNAAEPHIRETLRAVPESIGTLLIVGHNPGLMEAATHLADDGDVTELSRMRDRFPTCCLAVISFDAESWRDAPTRGGRLDLLLTPADVAFDPP